MTGSRVRHLQRTIFAKAVFNFEFASTNIVVAGIAEPFSTTAVEQGDRATKHAFPVDEFGTVYLARILADSHLFHQAWTA